MVARTAPELAQAVDVIMELSEDERARMLAEAREKYRRDEASRRDGAYRTGRQEGRQEGRLEGLRAGESQGRREERLSVAKLALRKNMPHEDIAELTGLSPDEIKALAEEITVSH